MGRFVTGVVEAGDDEPIPISTGASKAECLAKALSRIMKAGGSSRDLLIVTKELPEDFPQDLFEEMARFLDDSAKKFFGPEN